MSDIALQFNDQNNQFDIGIENGDLVMDDGLETAVVLSLFLDRRSTDAMLSDNDAERRGWWADEFNSVDGDLIGSHLWRLQRKKQSTQSLIEAERFSEEALQWSLEDGVAESVNVSACFPAPGILSLSIELHQPGNTAPQWQRTWEAQING